MSAPGVLSTPFIKDPVSRAQGEGLTSGVIYPMPSSCRALSVLHLLYPQRNSGACLRSDCQELADRPFSTILLTCFLYHKIHHFWYDSMACFL